MQSRLNGLFSYSKKLRSAPNADLLHVSHDENDTECHGQIVDRLLQHFSNLAMGSRAFRVGIPRSQRRRMERSSRPLFRGMQCTEINHRALASAASNCLVQNNAREPSSQT